MVTTLISSPATERFVSSRVTAPVPTSNLWLGGMRAFDCGIHAGMYAAKRLHPGLLGGMT